MTRKSPGGAAQSGWRAGSIFLLPLIALWVVPVGLFLIFFPVTQSHETAALTAKPPTMITVGGRLNDARQAVDVVVSTASAPQIKSNASGVVTDVPARAGDTLSNGSRLVTINGTTVVAYLEPAPLYRDLTLNDSGEDVTQLSEFLVSQKLLAPPDKSATFTPAVRSATDAFEKSVGAGQDGLFKTSFVAWVPSGITAISSVSVAVGDSVGAGQVIVSGAQAPSAIKFSQTGSGGTSPTVPQGPLRLTSGTTYVDFGSLTPTPSERQRIANFLAAAAKSGAATTAVSGSSTTYSGVILSVAKATNVGTVPSSSLYVSAANVTCVFVASNNAPSSVVLSDPQLIAGELDSVAVPESLVGKKVVLNPTALPAQERQSCKSTS